LAAESYKDDIFTAMDADEKCIRLAERIAKILREGIHLSGDVIHFIDSTFSNPCMNELEKIISDQSDCERDSLIELIFFPDEEFQAKLEDLLENHHYCREDEQKVLHYLSSKPIESTIRFPHNQGVMNVIMPDEITGRFLTRLNIHRKIDNRIAAAIEKDISEKMKPRVRVKLRNTDDELSEDKILFLCNFFKKTKDESGDFIECLDLILSFLGEIEDTKGLFGALMNKKRFHFKNVQRAEKFSQRLEKANMETIILQGGREPYVSVKDEKRKMELIDQISLTVFGSTEYFENAHPRIEAFEKGDF